MKEKLVRWSANQERADPYTHGTERALRDGSSSIIIAAKMKAVGRDPSLNQPTTQKPRIMRAFRDGSLVVEQESKTPVHAGSLTSDLVGPMILIPNGGRTRRSCPWMSVAYSKHVGIFSSQT